MKKELLFLQFLSWEQIDEEVSKMNVCVLSGKINKIDIKKDEYWCLDNVFINLKTENKDFTIQTLKTTENICEIDLVVEFFNNTNPPKIDDKMNVLLKKDDYTIISSYKNLDWSFKLISGNNYKNNFISCNNNEEQIPIKQENNQIVKEEKPIQNDIQKTIIKKNPDKIIEKASEINILSENIKQDKLEEIQKDQIKENEVVSLNQSNSDKINNLETNIWNSNPAESDKDYFFFWTWIIFVLILTILLYKRFKK